MVRSHYSSCSYYYLLLTNHAPRLPILLHCTTVYLRIAWNISTQPVTLASSVPLFCCGVNPRLVTVILLVGCVGSSAVSLLSLLVEATSFLVVVVYRSLMLHNTSI